MKWRQGESNVQPATKPWIGFAGAILLGISIGGVSFALNEVLHARSYPAEHIKGVEEFGVLGRAIRGFKIGVVIGALSGVFAGAMFVVARISGSTNT